MGIKVFLFNYCTHNKNKHAADDSTVTILYPQGDMTLLGPHYNEWARFLMYLPLIEYNEQGEEEPKLAERWEHSPDYRKWTIYLRNDVTWHDGMLVTAHDIKFTSDLLGDPDAPLFYGPYPTVMVLDDFTYSVELDVPSNPLMWWRVYYPKHLLEDLAPEEMSEWDFWQHPVGNGPYRYVRHIPKTMVVLEANPEYFRVEPEIKKIVLMFGGSSAAVELLAGNVDIVKGKYDDVMKVREDPRFSVHYSRMAMGDHQVALLWNQRTPFFQDPKVRSALTMAINRSELLKVMNLPDNLPISDVFFSARQELSGKIPEPLPYDPIKAGRLLDEAGWRIKNEARVREREGVEFSFSALVSWKPDLTEPAAIYVQEQLRRIGVRLEVEVRDGNTLGDLLRDGNFDAVFFPMSVQYILDRMKWIGYENPRINQILEEMRIQPVVEEYDRILYELMPILSNDIPFIILFPAVEVIIAHKRIKGFRSPFLADPYYVMEHLWIEPLK